MCRKGGYDNIYYTFFLYIIFGEGGSMKRILLVFITIFVLFTGCSNKNDKNINLGNEDVKAQPYWNIYNQKITASEDGYYFLKKDFENGGTYLRYIDANTMETIYVCNKAECKHDGIGCNAYFDNSYITTNIYYYKNYIYVLKNDESDGNVYLVKITADGNSRQKMFSLGTKNISYKLVFSNDYIYLYNRRGSISDDDTKQTIRKISLDGKEDDVVFEFDEKGCQISAVKSYGDNLFIMINVVGEGDKESRTMVTMSGKGVYSYNTKTKETNKVIDDKVTDFTVNIEKNTIFYYVANKGLYKKEFDKNEVKKIFNYSDKENNYAQLSSDKQYIYINNEFYRNMILTKSAKTYTWVIDYDGNQINKIETPGIYSTYFGDKRNTFCIHDGDVQYISKSRINFDTEWHDIK